MQVASHRWNTSVAVFASALIASHSSVAADGPQLPAASGNRAAPRHSSEPYSGPAVSFETGPGASPPRVRVTFPTGGWDLRADQSAVTAGLGVAHLTLIGPGANQIVTQALVEREWDWPTKERISRAEVWINVVRRGQPSAEPEYRLAARFPAAKVAGEAEAAPTGYRCGEQDLRVAFEESRATVTLEDGTVVALDRLESAAEPAQRRTFTNGRLTFVQQVGAVPRVLFARGRMTPEPCDLLPGDATPGGTGTQSDAVRPQHPLVGKVWVATDSAAAPGTFRIFLPDGTLVMDSCWETYRLAAWRSLDDRRLEWTEDSARIEARVAEFAGDRLTLELSLTGEMRRETDRRAHVPTVCPELPR